MVIISLSGDLWDGDEVDEAAFDIGLNQAHPCPITDIQTLLVCDDAAFHGRMEQSHEGAFRHSTGHDSVKSTGWRGDGGRSEKITCPGNRLL